MDIINVKASPLDVSPDPSSLVIVLSCILLAQSFSCLPPFWFILILVQDEVWSDAIVRWPENSVVYPHGSIQEMALVYSYFNGVYAKDDSRTSEGRPIYVEQKKSDRTPFDAVVPDQATDPVVGAEIKYCRGHWILTHKYIRKSRDEKVNIKYATSCNFVAAFSNIISLQLDDSGCHWLLRSPETDVFDFLEVGDGGWQVWAGVISDTKLSSVCNKCSDDSDCNLNGECNTSNGECKCRVEDGTEYFGTHCEIKIKDQCRTIV